MPAAGVALPQTPAKNAVGERKPGASSRTERNRTHPDERQFELFAVNNGLFFDFVRIAILVFGVGFLFAHFAKTDPKEAKRDFVAVSVCASVLLLFGVTLHSVNEQSIKNRDEIKYFPLKYIAVCLSAVLVIMFVVAAASYNKELGRDATPEMPPIRDVAGSPPLHYAQPSGSQLPVNIARGSVSSGSRPRGGAHGTWHSKNS